MEGTMSTSFDPKPGDHTPIREKAPEPSDQTGDAMGDTAGNPSPAQGAPTVKDEGHHGETSHPAPADDVGSGDNR
jgi:hypothetical protein